MILQLDAGNTRVKWRVIAAEKEGRQSQPSEGYYLMAENSAKHDQQFCRYLLGLDLAVPDRVLVANVRGDGFQTALTDCVRSTWAIKPEFAEPLRFCAGVTNGYEAPERLGVDRWLALLAAFDLAKTDCRILNCGTTVTLDLVDSNGMHLGGYIVPGLHLMRQTLQARAPKLVSASDGFDSVMPGRDTSAAICHGILAMMAGFVAGIRERDEKAGLSPRWIISGGDGEIVKSQLPWSVELVPSLVMDGLSKAFP